MILHAMQSYDWFEKATREMIETCVADEQLVLWIKFHPRLTLSGKSRGINSMSTYEAMIPDRARGRLFNSVDRFDDLLTACDAISSGSSTALLEGILLGKAALCLNYSTDPDWYPFTESGGAIGVSNRKELLAAISGVKRFSRSGDQDRDRERFLRRHAGPTAEGKGGEAFARWFRRVCMDKESTTCPQE